MSSKLAPKVLVTGASGDSAQGVICALRSALQPYFVASVCIKDNNPGFFMSDISAIAPAYKYEDDYIEFLIKFIIANSIDVLIPTIDGELTLLARRKVDIEHETGVKIIIGAHQDILTCCNKDLTVHYLDDISIDQPDIIRGGFNEVESYLIQGIKVIMKPRFGGGSRGIRILGQNDFGLNNWKLEGYIYQRYEEFITEFTSVVLKDGPKITAIAVLERRLQDGRTTWCRRVKSVPFEDMLKRISTGLDVPYINIQFGRAADGIKVFDLNPRFSGSTFAFSKIFNGPDLLVRKVLEGNMPNFFISERFFESIRYLSNYFSDCSADE